VNLPKEDPIRRGSSTYNGSSTRPGGLAVMTLPYFPLVYRPEAGFTYLPQVSPGVIQGLIRRGGSLG